MARDGILMMMMPRRRDRRKRDVSGTRLTAPPAAVTATRLTGRHLSINQLSISGAGNYLLRIHEFHDGTPTTGGTISHREAARKLLPSVRRKALLSRLTDRHGMSNDDGLSLKKRQASGVVVKEE